MRGNPKVSRARRLISPIIAALPLLLFATVVALWVRSYWVYEDVSLTRYKGYGERVKRTYAGARIWPGGLQVLWMEIWDVNPKVVHRYRELGRLNTTDLARWSVPVSALDQPPFFWKTWLGFRFDPYRTSGESNEDSGCALLIPFWFLSLLAALLPSAQILRWKRRKRRAQRRIHGFCIACGYDLRSSPVRCPECGREPDAK
jgi:hypothetical protein